MTFEVHNEEVEARLKAIGERLAKNIPPGYGMFF